ncbi:MAG: hypothetical protein CVU48_01590 [Candidatus Cloacimonetes bacterium HGW-Cloacimonetes-1]|jgi:type I restriction enzyme S subunit|nr:MAG: hypothetical protein CVU48_01590 [Candidatus Cloacimonetes bacterium HGW-Cloacimonetes-1]
MSEWKNLNIPEFASIVSGATPATNIKEYWDGDIMWVTPNDLSSTTSRFIHSSERKISSLGQRSASTTIIPARNVVMSSRAPIGYFALPTRDFTTNQGCKTFVFNDKHDPEYHYYNFLFHTELFKRYGSGSTFMEISKANIERLSFLIPVDRAEQHKIATILSTVDKVIEMTEAAIEKYKAIKAGMLQDLFTRGIDVKTGKLRPSYQEAPELYKETNLGWIPKEWEVRLIKDFSKIVSGSTPTTNNEEYWNGDINWITPADMSKIQHQYFSDTDRRITTKGMMSCSATLLPVNSIVMSSRAPIGYFAIGLEPFTTNQGCKSFNLTEGQNAEYQYYNMLHNVGLFLRLGSGSTFAEITKSQIEKIMLPIAIDHNEQKAISHVLIYMDKTIQKEEMTLVKNLSLKQGLMHDLLTGRIRIKLTMEE